MLTQIWLPTLSAKKEVWSQFDPKNDTWVVSDIKSKLFLRQNLLNKNQNVFGDPVLRASELWRTLLHQSDPDFSVIGSFGTKIYIKEYLNEDTKSPWCQKPGATQRLLSICQDFAPLIVHPECESLSHELIQNYDSHDPAKVRDFLILAHRFYKHLYFQNLMSWVFLPSYLAQTQGDISFSKKIYFDLGHQLQDGEKEIIQRLSKSGDVVVLTPSEKNDKLNDQGLFVYKHFDMGLTAYKSQSFKKNNIVSKTQVHRCSSPLSEARKAVEVCVDWIKQGVSIDQICFAAPDSSLYEDLILHDLRWEGAGLSTGGRSSLLSSRLFRVLNARLRLVLGEVNGKTLTEAFLVGSSYKSSLQRVYEQKVLNPVLEFKEIPLSEISKKTEFYSSTYGFLKGLIEISRFEEILFSLFDEVKAEFKLNTTAPSIDEMFLKAVSQLRREVGSGRFTLASWISAWNDLLSKEDFVVNQDSKGVLILDLASLEDVSATHIILMGNIERRRSFSLLNELSPDQHVYLKQLGFEFNALQSDLKRKSFLNWVQTGSWKELALTTAVTDLDGRVQSPNLFWVENAKRCGLADDLLSETTRLLWNQIQKGIFNNSKAQNFVDEFRKRSEGDSLKLGERIKSEFTEKQLILKSVFNKKLSASKLETYWQCPFKFMASSLFRLFDEEDLEIEPSPQKRGQCLHAMLEKILTSKRGLDSWSDQELNELIDNVDLVQARLSYKVWPSIRARYLRLLKRFIEYEKQCRTQYKHLEPFDFEAKLRGFLSWDEKEIKFSSHEPKDGKYFSFSGSIDRIDKVGGEYAIVDYKSSDYQISNLNQWNKNGRFQLPLYAMAVEAGLCSSIKEEKPRIRAAQFYSLKRMGRDKGFYAVAHDNLSIPGAERASSVSPEEKKEFFNELEGTIKNLLNSIESGEFSPKPRKLTECEKCSWSTLCRAPHLL